MREWSVREPFQGVKSEKKPAVTTGGYWVI